MSATHIRDDDIFPTASAHSQSLSFTTTAVEAWALWEVPLEGQGTSCALQLTSDRTACTEYYNESARSGGQPLSALWTGEITSSAGHSLQPQ